MQTAMSTTAKSRFRELAGLCGAAAAAAVMSACPGPEAPDTSRPGAPELAARISARERYPVGAPVPIDFALANRGREPVWVLIWDTPLEGMQNEMFRVTRDGQSLDYVGILVKRGDPGPEEYRRIEPGGELSATVDLAQGYELAAPGAYEVTLDTQLADVAVDPAGLPRARDLHEGRDLRAGPVRFRID